MIFQINMPEHKSLCVTCKHSTIFETRNGNITTYCSSIMSTRVPDTVVKCNDYNDRNHPSVHEMEDLAWILNTNDKKVVGFTPPADHNKRF